MNITSKSVSEHQHTNNQQRWIDPELTELPSFFRSSISFISVLCTLDSALRIVPMQSLGYTPISFHILMDGEVIRNCDLYTEEVKAIYFLVSYSSSLMCLCWCCVVLFKIQNTVFNCPFNIPHTKTPGAVWGWVIPVRGAGDPHCWAAPPGQCFSPAVLCFLSEAQQWAFLTSSLLVSACPLTLTSLPPGSPWQSGSEMKTGGHSFSSHPLHLPVEWGEKIKLTEN